MPPQALWPAGTQPFGKNAAQTPFALEKGQARILIRLSPPGDFAFLDFVLFFPESGRWDNNDGRNYQIVLAEPGRTKTSPLALLRVRLGEAEKTFERAFDLEGLGQLAAGVTRSEHRHRVILVSDLAGPLTLHWGIARSSPREWLLPPPSLRPEGTLVREEKAAQTAFTPREGMNCLELDLPAAEAPLGVQFVLKRGDDGKGWIQCQGANFYVPVGGAASPPASPGEAAVTGLADEIIRAETGRNSWTLMHRFDLCFGLLDRVQNQFEELAVLFVWLRFSAIRQLTWQRNFNTKPRELAHAQDRLTLKLTDRYRGEPAARPLLRLMLTTVGRGGEGQNIRDEILNIMHRHHLKEVSGHFLEEWHQKLHNNTTPDDVVICEAYLEFLRGNGDRDRFYRRLREGGVTRQRLESFERPIRSQPDFVPHLKEGLIHDFQNFLRILKAAHSGTDLETAINAARGQVDGAFQGLLHYLWEHRNDPPETLVNQVNQLTDGRRRLAGLLNRGPGLRELLYLDLALEQWLRLAIERGMNPGVGLEALGDLIARVLENVTLSFDDPELGACARHWERLLSLPRAGAPWALHAKSVGDRMARALSAWTDRFYQLLQPKAEYLGRSFQAEPWTIALFSEEVVRGNSLGFVLSLLLHHLDPRLRLAAHLGNWQIISPGRGAGTVEVVASLQAIQARTFSHPTVVVTDQVMGDEEIPEGVQAIIAPDVTDIVSHVAVRARNGNVLFAACHNAEMLAHLKSLGGHHLELQVSPAGDVLVNETAAESPATTARARVARPVLAPRRFTKYAVAPDDFNGTNVGGKSFQQARLRGKLPDWIGLPRSVALPFGVFEEVLGQPQNRDAARRYQEGARQAEGGEAPALAAVRESVLALTAPAELPAALREVMIRAGLGWPEDWNKMWNRIQRVWASKWNDRAFLSRQKLGIPHENLQMAVLIQEVVRADYAFVIHTVNPSTGNARQLFAEVVLGLGETLVGNYPGRALSFVFDKPTATPTLLSYPGKSTGLYGGGLIFRSDSNGEDLAGFAGAGLYDSVLLEEPRPVALDYCQEPLLWDETFRRNLLTTIARVGLEVERVCGSPQDIEGAVAQGHFHVVQTRPQVGLE